MMRKRLAILLTGLGAGGAERVVMLLANHWVAQGHEVHIISFDAPDAPIYFDVPPTVALHRLDLSHPGLGPLRVLRRLMALRRVLVKIEPDTLISFLTKNNVLALLSTWGRSIHTVVCERNNPMRQEANSLWGRLLARLYPLADAIVMQTRASLVCLPKGVESAAFVIPNPIETPTALPPEESEPKILVAVGRLVSQKGFDLLIDAFAPIQDEFSDWQLKIFGDGPLRDSLASRISACGGSERIFLAGQTDTPGAWIREGHAFVLSSRFEGFPNVLGEAMAAGMPVVSFDCPFGPAEMVTDGVDGLLVPDGDVEELANALRRLLSNRDFRAKLANEARKSSARFTVPRVAAQWDALLDTLGETKRDR
ncbi:glycosyltransferase family 4 protein (plasmid) [Ruegeria sp. B32]|nr:glycosyltransferase family 4 protein [Ruegeria sp. B32]UWR09359.1 glycosyltransferase family 4 protein [Ruegeria sp. B32]